LLSIICQQVFPWLVTVEINPRFPSAVLARAKTAPGGLFFPRIDEHGWTYTPNGLDFLGFCTRPYADSEPYHTANSQCLILSSEVTRTILFDEIVSLYGYEEYDFAYRVAAAGFAILPVIERTCTHWRPTLTSRFARGRTPTGSTSTSSATSSSIANH
jgi:hypothetical protein